MLPLLLGVIAGGLILKNSTGYPSEIRNLQKQMTKEDSADFIHDYKKLPNETKTQFKQYLRAANLTDAGKLIGKDLSGYTVDAKAKEQKPAENMESSDAVSAVDNGFSERIKNILNAAQFDFDPQLVAEAEKKYENIAGYNDMNIVDKTRKILDVSQ